MSAEIEPGLSRENESRPSGEWVKFGILVIVLVVVLLVVALTRPLIFGRIVPAVMGEGQMPAPLLEDPNQSIRAPEEGEAPGAGEGAAKEEVIETGEVPAKTNDQPENPADFPTSIPAISHVVRGGENLTMIANQYNVSVEAIVAANSITDPDRIKVGDTLLIPRP